MNVQQEDFNKENPENQNSSVQVNKEESDTKNGNPENLQNNSDNSKEQLNSDSDDSAMENLMRPPPQMSFEGNIKNNWKLWYQKYKIYMQASGLDTKSEERQVAVLLHIIGDQGQEKFDTFGLSDEDKKSIEKVINAFDKYCTPKANETMERFLFFTRAQEQGESFMDFLTDLRKLSATCGFGNLKDSLVKDRIVLGVNDEDVQRRLLKEQNLDLEKSISICQAAELAKSQVKMINTESNKVHILRTKHIEKENKREKDSPEHKGFDKSRSWNSQQQTKTCSRCGGIHKPRQCPAYGKTCSKCSRLHHFASVCRSTTKAVDAVDTHTHLYSQTDTDDSLFIDMVKCDTSAPEWLEPMLVNKKAKIQVKLDSGAQCNVISLASYNEIKTKNSVLKDTNTKISAFGGGSVQVIGKVDLLCKFNNRAKCILEFVVVKGKQTNIPTVIGLPTLTKLNLIARVDSINVHELTDDKNVQELLTEFEDVFSGTGYIKGFEYEIKLTENYTPKIHPCRRVPITLMKTLKEKLKSMEDKGIIKKVDQPTEWVHPLVLAKKKDGNLRICLDPTDLNQYIQKEPQQIPSFEELTSNMAGSKIFSTLDADSAFWQIKITDKTSDLLTFSTPFGRWKFLCLPYGIISASEVFQFVFMEIFGDISGVGIYIDDIKISAKNHAEHNKILAQVLQRAREYNVRFNINKCNFSKEEIKYMGHKLTPKGIELDESRVKAITEMRPPTTKEQLETFLGMVTYVSKFIPNFSETSSTLRDLTKKNSIWYWDANADKAFQNIKNLLAKAPVLKYFNVDEPVTLSVDASQSGLGAVILQENLPVGYASRSLTQTEQRYAQIEKEALAIAFGCARFHQYIYGKNVLVESDHKPLETIFKKPLNMCPARIQRIKLSLQKYDLTVRYKPGKQLLLADALSRSHLEETSNTNELLEAHVCMIMENLPISIERKEEFVKETQNDPEMKLLTKFIVNGWPLDKTKLPDLIKPYHTFNDELAVIEGLIFKGERLVVPRKLRKIVLNKIHYCHLGIQKCKLRAREIVYWPNMNKDISDLIEKCHACCIYKNANVKEPMILRKIPDGPWQTIGVDLFHFKGSDYLLVIDYYTKYVEVAKLMCTDSAYTISRLKSIFARFGIPGETVFSDNGPQFNSLEMRKFAKEWNFVHSTSSPTYPQSNGMVERHIQTIKNIFKKVEVDNKDPSLALLEYRNTPIDSGSKSPNEMMLGRKVRGIVPIIRLDTELDDQQSHKDWLSRKQHQQKYYYDRNAHSQVQPKVNDHVYIRTKPKKPLQAGKIISKCERPRSFKVELNNGQNLERNRRHLYVRKEKSIDTSNDDEPYENENENKQNNAPLINNAALEHDASTNPSSSANDPLPETTCTRSGRRVKPPAYLKDYVT